MSRILFDAFDGGGTPPPVTVAIDVDITSDFTVAAVLSEQITIAAAVDITADFTVAASLVAATGVVLVAQVDITNDFSVAANVLVTTPVVMSATVDITDDFSVTASMRAGAVFLPPEPGNQRVAVVAHIR